MHSAPWALRGVPSRRRLVLARALALVTLVCGAGGCGDDSSPSTAPTPTTPMPPPPEPESNLNRSVTSVTVDGHLGRWRTDHFPEESGGPRINVIGNSSIINGGATELLVEGNGLTAIAIGDRQGRGYYELQLLGRAASPAATVQRFSPDQTQIYVLVRLTFAAQLPGAMELYVAGLGPGNAVGRAVRHAFSVVEVGTGDLQINLSWDTDADVDLHVVEPSGETIYWANRNSRTGGLLDLDSNAGCRIDGVRNENITWARGAPRGSFTVFVNYFSSCGVPNTNYIVRFNCGRDSRLETGTFTGRGNANLGPAVGRPAAVFSCR